MSERAAVVFRRVRNRATAIVPDLQLNEETLRELCRALARHIAPGVSLEARGEDPTNARRQIAEAILAEVARVDEDGSNDDPLCMLAVEAACAVEVLGFIDAAGLVVALACLERELQRAGRCTSSRRVRSLRAAKLLTPIARREGLESLAELPEAFGQYVLLLAEYHAATIDELLLDLLELVDELADLVGARLEVAQRAQAPPPRRLNCCRLPIRSHAPPRAISRCDLPRWVPRADCEASMRG